LEHVVPRNALDLELRQQKAILGYANLASSRDCKWSIRRFEELSFLLLYNMHIEITELETQIHVAEGVISKFSRERLQILLRDYSDVMRNIDYLTGLLSAKNNAAAFESRPVFPGLEPDIHTRSDYVAFHTAPPALDQVRITLKRFLAAFRLAQLAVGPQLTVGKNGMHSPGIPHSKQRSRADGLTAEVPWFVNGLARIIVAITGGVFLLVPMIIMTRATDVHMRLIVVSIAVLWFTVSVALCSTATNQELIAATAAYTAVLVVYVGTASGVSI